MKKLTCSILLLLCVVLTVTACQPADLTTAPPQPATTESTAPTTASTTAPTTVPTTVSAAFPVTVLNGSGDEVTIESEPRAIVITNVWAAEILFELIDVDRIKGLSAWGDSPAISAAADRAALVKQRVATGQPEGIVALSPDLVIIDSFSDFDGSLAKTLNDAGAVVLSLNSPTDFEQIKEAIATLATAVGAPEKGQALIDSIDNKLKRVTDALAGLTDEDRLSVMFYDSALDANGNDTGMLCAYGSGSPFDAIARAAGLINVVDVATYSSVSKEKVVAEWKPDVLIVSSLVYGPDFSVTDDGGQAMISAIKSSDLLRTVPAVEKDRVFALTANHAGSTSHYMADAVYELAKVAYPELID